MIGRIYKLECKLTSKFYICSTIHNLVYRLKKHRSSSKEIRKQNSPLYSHFREVGWNNANMSLIKEVTFESRRDLLEMEKVEILKFLGDELCLNHNRPLQTLEEKLEQTKEYGKIHRQLNKERQREKLNEWRKNNPEKWKEQTKRYNEKKKQERLEGKKDST